MLVGTGRFWEGEVGGRGVVCVRRWVVHFLGVGGVGVHRWHLWAQLKAWGPGLEDSGCSIAF